MIWVLCVFVFKQKTAYEMRISDWSSDVCSSDLIDAQRAHRTGEDETFDLRFERGVHGVDQAFDVVAVDRRHVGQPEARIDDAVEHAVDRKSTRLNSSH